MCVFPCAWILGLIPDERANLGRMVEQWGLVPLAYLAHFSQASFTYGYIGTEDFSMYPLLPPGRLFRSMNPRTRLCREYGGLNMSVQFTSSRLGRVIPAAGAL